MSALDIVARGMAAQASRAVQDIKPQSHPLFADIGSFVLAEPARMLSTRGHGVAGRGIGIYLADDFATEALLAAHPRHCARTANGRIVRLVASEGSISVEQGGALGDPDGTRTIDDRTAIQATFDYAAEVGIARVTFEQREYTVWNTVRTSPTTDSRARDGRPLVLSDTVSIVSAAGDTYLHFRGPAGESLDATVFYAPKTAGGPADQVWRGGGLMVLGRAQGSGSGTTVDKLTIDHIHFVGGRGRSAAEGVQIQSSPVPQPVDGWDYSDKGLIFSQVDIGMVELNHVEVTGFKGELVYFGGGAGPRLILSHCHFHDTNGDAFNPGMVHPESMFSHCRIGNAYQGIESLGGAGQTWNACIVYNTAKNWLAGGPTPTFKSGYSYAYTTRDEAAAVPWVNFNSMEFRDAGNTQLGSWSRGSIRLTDTSLTLAATGGLRDVDLTITAMADLKSGMSACSLGGPADLVTQVAGCPEGTYQQPPTNVRVRVGTCGQTELARRNSHRYNAVFTLTGLYGEDVVLSAGDVVASRYLDIPAQLAQLPTVRLPDSFRMVGTGQPLGGGYINAPVNATTTLDPANLAYLIYPGGTGVCDIALAAPATTSYADGQPIRLVHGGGANRLLRFRRYNGGVAMETEVVLFEVNDWIEFTWDQALSRWRYRAHSNGGERFKYGSTTYTATAIAAGTSRSFTMTVRNALVGDAVSLAATGDLLGLVANARVTATHTVTVTLYNLSTASITPAAMTFQATVMRAV